jgi:hypothetical protein
MHFTVERLPYMKAIFLVIILLLFVSAASATEPRYFPIDASGGKGVSAFEQRWYSPILKKMGEPSLIAAKDAGVRLFRFTLLPTWGNPISVRLSVMEESGTIEGKRLDGQAGYDPGKLVERTAVALSKADIDQFLSLYAKLKFFGLKTADDTLGCDGSQWILETVDKGVYHVVIRWSPTEYDPYKRQTVDFVNICKWLYRKSGFKKNATNKGYTEIDMR